MKDLLSNSDLAELWSDIVAAGPALRVLVIIVLAWVAIAVMQRAIRTLRSRIAARMDDREAIKRAETLGRVFRYLVAVVVSLVAGGLYYGAIRGLHLLPGSLHRSSAVPA
mgnify:CR=1 FL=1